MPTYDYRCEATGEVVEVNHSMKEVLRTWGEVCAHTGRDCGQVPAESPVQRLATGGQVVRRSSLGDSGAPPCSSGPCCGGGMCGIN